MPSQSIKITGAVGGSSINQKAVTRTKAGQINVDPTLNRAYAGTLAVRTDDNTGTITLGAGHGIQTGDVVDIFWGTPGNGDDGVQYKSTVGTVSGTSVPIDLGVGSNLPAQATAVIVCKRLTIDIDVAFQTLGEQIFAHCSERYRLEFQQSDGTLILGVNIRADEPFIWSSGNGYTNPITGAAIGKCEASQAGTDDSPPKLNMSLLFDAD